MYMLLLVEHMHTVNGMFWVNSSAQSALEKYAIYISRHSMDSISIQVLECSHPEDREEFNRWNYERHGHHSSQNTGCCLRVEGRWSLCPHPYAKHEWCLHEREGNFPEWVLTHCLLGPFVLRMKHNLNSGAVSTHSCLWWASYYFKNKVAGVARSVDARKWELWGHLGK